MGGALLFYTDRNIKKELELAKESTSAGKNVPSLPGDIHNYSGWRNGGRSDPSGFDPSSDSSDD